MKRDGGKGEKNEEERRAGGRKDAENGGGVRIRRKCRNLWGERTKENGRVRRDYVGAREKAGRAQLPFRWSRNKAGEAGF